MRFSQRIEEILLRRMIVSCKPLVKWIIADFLWMSKTRAEMDGEEEKYRPGTNWIKDIASIEIRPISP
jgi:hypothetical protein